MRKFFNRFATGSGVAMLPGLALAQSGGGVDVSEITTAFSDATSAVGSIAAVMLGVVAAGIAVKWVLGFIIN